MALASRCSFTCWFFIINRGIATALGVSLSSPGFREGRGMGAFQVRVPSYF